MSKPVKTVQIIEHDRLDQVSDHLHPRLGTKTEYKDKKVRHRADGPAVIIQSDDLIEYSEMWFERGRCHRIGGPAKTEYRKLVGGDTRHQYEFILHEWYYKGKLHREDGPAYERNKNGDHYLSYFRNGSLHREDGPAVMSYHSPDDFWMYSWVLNGVSYSRFSQFCETAKLSEYEILLLTLKYKFLNGVVPRSSK